MRGFNGISVGAYNYWENDALLSGNVLGDRQLGVGDKYNNYSEGSVVEGNVGRIHAEGTVGMQVKIGFQGEVGRMAVETPVLGPQHLVAVIPRRLWCRFINWKQAWSL